MPTGKTARMILTCAVLWAASANAATLTIGPFPLDAAQEVPAPTLNGATPSGTGTVTLDTETNTMSWDVSYQGLTGGIVAPGAHFHGPAPPGVPASVKAFLADGSEGFGPSGQLTGSASLGATDVQELLDGLWYVNLHTEQNQPGEIRGQIVPEPAAAAGLALGILFAARRHHSRVC